MDNSGSCYSSSSNTQSNLDEENLRLIQICNQKREVEPTSKKALLLRANIYIKLNRYDEAKADLNSLLTEQLLASTIYYLLGVISKKEDNLNESIHYLSKSIELDCNNVNALFLRGAILNLQGKFNEAINDYSLALEKDSLKNAKTNVYKNIEKILDLGTPCEDNNNYIETSSANTNETDSKHVKAGTQVNVSSNNIDDEINRNLHFILRRGSDLSPAFMEGGGFGGRSRKKWQTSKMLTDIEKVFNEEFDNGFGMRGMRRRNTVGNNCENLQEFQKQNNIDINTHDYNYDYATKGSNVIKEEEDGEHDVLVSPDKTSKYLNLNTEMSDNGKWCNNDGTSNSHCNMPISSSAKSKAGKNINVNSINDLCGNLFGSYQLETESSIPISPRKHKHKQSNNSNNTNSNKKHHHEHDHADSKGNPIRTKQNLEKYINISLCHSSSAEDSDDNNNKRNNHNNYNENSSNNNKESENLYNQGLDHRKKGDFKHAIDLFSKVLTLTPNHFKSLFNKAFCLDKVEKYQESIDNYTNAIQINNTYPYTFYNRGIVYDKLGLYQQSIADFTKAIELHPHKKEFYYNRAFSYKKSKNYLQAINDFSHYISFSNRKDFNALFNRGTCYEKTTAYCKAIADFEQCVQLNPKLISPLYHLANISYKTNNNSTASKYFDVILDINPKYAPAYHGLGLINEKERNYIMAIEFFTRAININPSNSAYYYNRACVYQTIGVVSQAINDLTEAIALNGNNVMFYENRAYLYAKNKEYQLAIDDYEFILEKEKCNVTARKNKEFCLAKLYKDAY